MNPSKNIKEVQEMSVKSKKAVHDCFDKTPFPIDI